MWEVKIVDRNKKILGLKWSGNVKKEEVAQANEKLEQYIKQLQTDSFDLIIEMENIMAFSKETQQAIVEQQKWIIEKGMKRAAVLGVDKATTKMQLKRTSQASNNSNEHFFSSYEEALSFLQNN